MRAGLLALLAAFVILLLVTIARWAYADGSRRGKSGWLIVLLIFLLPVVGWLIWLGIRPPIQKETTSRIFVPSDGALSTWVLLWNVALGWYMVGLVWVGQLVVYPMRVFLGPEHAAAYVAKYPEYIAIPVLIPNLLLAVAAVLLIWFRPRAVPSWPPWTGALLSLVLFVLVFTLYAPLQMEAAKHGFTEAANAKLLRIHWTRVAADTAYGLLLLWMAARTIYTPRE